MGSIFVFVFVILARLVVSLDNGLALTPPMGWMTWGVYKCNVDCDAVAEDCINEGTIKRIADEFDHNGYADAGYEYIVVDDCWMEKVRDADGRLIPDRKRFPRGMKYLADYVHAKKLKFGIYQNFGKITCKGYPGSLGYLEIDAYTFAEWEVDYVKFDGCFSEPHEIVEGYPEFGRFLNKTGRPMVYSCSWPYYLEHIYKQMPDYSEVRKYCNLWRNYHDIDPNWKHVNAAIYHYGNSHKRMASYSGPGGWNDPDMLMIGNEGVTDDQSRIQMVVWAVLAAPLIMSNKLQSITATQRELLLNKDIIGVNQDPLGLQGKRYRFNDVDVWIRRVVPVKSEYYSYAVAFINMHPTNTKKFRSSLEILDEVYPDGYTMKDLLTSEELENITTFHTFDFKLPPYGVKFYKLLVL